MPKQPLCLHLFWVVPLKFEQSKPIPLCHHEVKKKFKKRKSPRGGTYRAFVHLATYGQKGSPNLKEVAQRYKAHMRRGAHTLQASNDLGKLATEVGSSILPGNSSFGPKSRQVFRTLQKARRQGLLKMTAGMSIPSKASFLANMTSIPRGGLSNAIAEAKKLMRLEGQQKKQDERGHVECLKKWQNNHGKPHLQGLLVANLACQVDKEHMLPMPSPLGCCFHVYPSCNEVVAKT